MAAFERDRMRENILQTEPLRDMASLLYCSVKITFSLTIQRTLGKLHPVIGLCLHASTDPCEEL